MIQPGAVDGLLNAWHPKAGLPAHILVILP